MRVIAYFMHEGEAAEALRLLSDVSATSSFVVGDIDESELPLLTAAGLTVDRLDEDAPVETPAVARADRGLGPDVAVGAEEGVRGEPLPREPDAPAQWLLRLGQPLLEEHRLEIATRGMVLHRAVPTHAYLATATPEQAEDVLNLPFVRSVAPYGPELAAPVRLAGGEAGAEEPEAGTEETVAGAPATRTWDLVLDDAGTRPAVREWLDRHAEERDALTVEAEGGRRLRIRLADGSRLEAAIPQLPGVMGMTEYVPPRLFNDVARVLLGVSSPGDPGAEPPLTGRDQIVAVADSGLDAAHPDFAGRVVDAVALGRPGDPSDPHGHGTHVAGSVLGDGSASQGAVRGVAPEARLYFQSVMDARGRLSGLPLSLEDLFEPAYQAGARIHNNSWGAPTEAAYTANSDDVDAFMRRRPDMLVVIAAGNDGTAAVRLHSDQGFVDWLSLGSPASSKNALTVGAARTSRTDGPTADLTWGQWRSGVPFPDSPIADEAVCGDPEALAAFSSRGPCDDWRVKPDVVAPGTDILSTRASTAPERNFWGPHPNSRYAFMGGTSMATPLVAGCAALVREFYVRERRARPSAALLKATLINGARTLTAADATARDPHFHQGFGAVHLPSSLPHPGRPELGLEFVDTWETPERQLQRTGTRVLFSVEAAAGVPLRVCLAYTDLPGRSLQNDLSLLMETPDGSKLAGNGGLPNRLLRTDSTNNVEVVRIPDPVPGRYLLQVFARSLLKGPQDYALVVTGNLTAPLRLLLG